MGLLVSGKNPAALKTAQRVSFTATAGQTVFNIPSGYNPGDLDVYMNGVRLVESDDFYASDGLNVTLVAAASAGDHLHVMYFNQFLVSNSYTKTESDTRYIPTSGITNINGYLRTPGYGISSTSDSQPVSLEASALAGTQGVAVKAYGRNMATYGGEISYITDTRGASGSHKFYGWNGSSLTTFGGFDPTGRWSQPFQPAFKAGRNSSYTPGANTTVVFNHDNGSGHYNIGNYYNPSTGIFTAPLSGRYQFICCLIFEGVANNTDMTDSFYVTINGSSMCYSFRRAVYNAGTTGNSGYFTDHASIVLNCSIGDQVSIKTRLGNVVHGNTQYSWFNGYFLG